MSYRRVTREDRLVIKAYLDEEISYCSIADKLGFHRSTIYREVGRNGGLRGYRAKQAQRLSMKRQLYCQNPKKMKGALIDQVEEKLRLRWSPEQISHRLRLEGQIAVSAETIYRHIHRDASTGGDLWRCLRRSRRQRKPRFPREDRRGTIHNARALADRPIQAQERKTLGHWERDSMIGLNRKTAVLVCTDRRSRYNVFERLDRRKAVLVTHQTIKALQNLPVRSITNDRGQEFSDHPHLEQRLGVKVYFCDPYSSYQRGTNENRIGLLRDYLPKKTDLSRVPWRQLKKIQFEINNRPMKLLDWRTPYEIMTQQRRTAFV